MVQFFLRSLMMLLASTAILRRSTHLVHHVAQVGRVHRAAKVRGRLDNLVDFRCSLRWVESDVWQVHCTILVASLWLLLLLLPRVLPLVHVLASDGLRRWCVSIVILSALVHLIVASTHILHFIKAYSLDFGGTCAWWLLTQ